MSISVRKIHPELPIFRLWDREHSILYTPGHLCPTDGFDSQEVQKSSSLEVRGQRRGKTHIPLSLMTAARQARQSWEEMGRDDFHPECLTVYLSHRCNLDCAYCYSAPVRNAGHDGVLREEVVLAAARLTAECCAVRRRDFRLVVHGGGEPTIHFPLIRRLVEKTRRIADDFKIGWKAHLATNGVVATGQALWLAKNFSSIGLSCDGPPEIHDLYRRRADGSGTYTRVEQTGKTILDAGGKLILRTTILPQTMHRQTAIVEHWIRNLGPGEIRFEPVYAVHGKAGLRFEAGQADEFVRHFLQAAHTAADLGANLKFSGVRLDELHGPYCNVLRNVLQLLPDGTATACFLGMETGSVAGHRAVIGRYDAIGKRFVLDEEKIRGLRRLSSVLPDRCVTCLCAYHCMRECPEICVVSDGPRPEPGGGFRCRVVRKLAEAWIWQAGMNCIGEEAATSAPILRSSDYSAEDSRLEELTAEVPAEIDTDLIRQEWTRARRLFPSDSNELPKPIWAERGFEHDGATAWDNLRNETAGRPNYEPLSMYLHLPFCRRRCRFCDCYAVVPPAHRRSQTEALFTRALLQEIDAWAQIPGLSDRTVTTVHFGGGTPDSLEPPLFASIAEACRCSFAVTAATEWALESPVRLLDDAHLCRLRQLGFTRIHSGVQTLEEPLRRRIGRQDPPRLVLERLVRAMEMGFVVSVDLVYGLPGQTIAGFGQTIRQLTEIGIHGLSLYRFNRSRRNREIWEGDMYPSGDRVLEYVLFHCAEQMLLHLGYEKNHFTHFARPEDSNLYYRHAYRGEDLLAFGPTADGILGPYRYRHPELDGFLAGLDSGRPTFQGGLRETAEEQYLYPLYAALLAAEIQGRLPDFLASVGLLEVWQEAALLRPGARAGTWTLAANGSQYIRQMLQQIKAASERLQIREAAE